MRYNIDKEESKEGEPSTKVVKLDNAKVPIHLWNNCIATALNQCWDKEIKMRTRKNRRFNFELKEHQDVLNIFLDVFREPAICCWRRRVFKSFR